MTSLETYLLSLRDIHRSGAGVEETSYYPALEHLLNNAGKSLKPKVRCIINIKNRGAGLPDGGLFTAQQFARQGATEPREGQIPERGAVEVKGTRPSVEKVAASEQVERYLKRYGQVLVTNLRDFMLVGADEQGRAVPLETYRLAASEAEFWEKAEHPRALAAEHSERFEEYLKRVMLHAAPLSSPEDVARFLASYARDARARVEQKTDLPALKGLREALEQALGLKFEGERGEHFFRSTLVQTLFYGIFSAWVLWTQQQEKEQKRERFDWRTAAWTLRVPMINALFEQMLMRSRLEPLGLVEVLDWAAMTLNRVENPAAFIEKFTEGHAVQYFYEPFLQEFDPELRKQLGVWYTPQEIVRYMVARVDRVLREELNVAEGLASEEVYVLDPCCGTGTYLVEVLRRIEESLRERGEGASAGIQLKRAAMSRVFGFEILPAPFVVAHLQLGLLLQSMDAALEETGAERVGVYLTNALTGWEPAREPKTHLLFPEMEEERDRAEEVKQSRPILVVLGNPPYNAFAGTSPEEEQGLVEPYKEGLNTTWGIRKFNLDDLYVRFFRLAERRIAEKSGRGAVCYISNYSYLSDPSFVVMRERFLQEFDVMWFDSLNGDSRETGKLTPEGLPDPSVFSTKYNKEGIRVGTAVGLMVRKAERDAQPTVNYREFWGVRKREELLESIDGAKEQYIQAEPDKSNRFSFRVIGVASHYLEWPKVVELCGELPISGLQEMRKGALMSINRTDLEKRVQMYYDAEVSWDALKALKTGLTEDGGRFDAKTTREKVRTKESFDDNRLLRYALYPFDVRWCYYSSIRPLWNEPRPALTAQDWNGNGFYVTRMMAERPNEQNTMMFTTALPDYHLLRPNAVAIPIRIKTTNQKETVQNNFFTEDVQADTVKANLSATARAYLASLGIENVDEDADTAGLIWMHALAIGYSPAYLAENADGIRNDWPRVPLPSSVEALRRSALLGRGVADILSYDAGDESARAGLQGITATPLRPEMKAIGVLAHAEGKQLKEGKGEDAGDLALTANWGYAGQKGVTMPGKGKIVTRAYTEEERAAIEEGARALGLSAEEAFRRVGEETTDVFLNDVAYWRNVPARVWDYYIGGYQVMKKWLSYRERELLGRDLTLKEANEVRDMSRRIAALRLLEPALDANYLDIKADTYAWADDAGKE
ncbi:MAG TPA: type ISP restriction/modification enzyme [Pyrinomonadaceae bacterium]|nr:type ISP restriction/modification enzyme [Pyrinomonadaceae bacterium]